MYHYILLLCSERDQSTGILSFYCCTLPKYYAVFTFYQDIQIFFWKIIYTFIMYGL